VSALDEILRITNARKAGDGWIGLCVGHDDSSPSLSIKQAGDKLLLNCHAGCDYQTVRDALKARGVELTEDRDAGWETVWTIYDRGGKRAAQHVRLDTADGKKVFWRGPNGEKARLADLGIRIAELPPYASERVGQAQTVYVCEGEKSADALLRIGLCAVGTFGAEVCPIQAALEFLRGRSVVLWPDNDPPGRKHMLSVAGNLAALGIKHRTLTWPDAPEKGDAADFVASGKKAQDVTALLVQGINIQTIADGLAEASAEMDRFEASDFSDRIQTGIPKLDRRLRGGLRGGQLTLLGAPSGGGKTTLVQQVAAVASRRGPVLFVTPEMSCAELAEREMVRRSGRQLWDRNPWTSPPETRGSARGAHMDAETQIATERPPIYILDRPDLTMLDVEEAAQQIPGLVLVAIDYAQQVATLDDARPRYLQVGDVGTRAVALAQRLKVPVIVASQVNVIKEGSSKSFAFRETAILEHKAHNVLIFDVEWEQGEFRKVKRAQICCTKQRSGQPFTLEVTYEPEIYRVSEKREEWYAQPQRQLRSLPFAAESDAIGT